MKQFFVKYKRDIIIGVLTSLITSGIIVIIGWLIKSAPTVGSTALDVLIDSIYITAAQQTHSTLVETIFSMAVWFGLAFVIQLLIHVFLHISKVYNLKKCINSGKETELFSPKAKAELPLDEKVESLYHSATSLRNKAILLMILTLILVAGLYFFYIKPHEIWTEFERDVTMIYPYTNEDEIHRLRSDWVCMRSKNDYVEIYKIIDDIKQVNSLPK